MTVLVGVRCSDGVVVGSDSRATSAMGVTALLGIESNSKLQIFPGNVIVATTGPVGFSQRLAAHVDLAIKGNVFKNMPRHECVANISQRFLKDCQGSFAQMSVQHGLGFGALLVAAIKGEPCLVEYATTDFQPEVKQDKLFFVSMGSGQVLADPFLAFVSRVLWKGSMPTVREAKFGVYWVLNHTLQLAPGGVGGPIRLAVLQQAEGQWVAQELQNIEEPAQYISELEDYIARFPYQTIEEAETKPLPLPPAQD